MRRKVSPYDVVSFIQNVSWPPLWERIKYRYDLPTIEDVLEYIVKNKISFLNLSFYGEDYCAPSLEQDGTYKLSFIYKDKEYEHKTFSNENDLNRGVLEYFFKIFESNKVMNENLQIPLTFESLNNCKHGIQTSDCIICSSGY